MKKKLAEFEVECKQLKTDNKQLKFDKTILEEKVDYLTKKLYGSKSEKIKKDDTPDLFNEAEKTVTERSDDDKNEDTIIEITYTRKKGKKNRKDGWDKLPVKENVVDIPEEEKTCACGKKMMQIGAETSEKLNMIPMQVEIIRTVRPKYACRCCQGVESEGIHPAVKIAPVPPSILPKSIVSASLLAYILINKFCDALPFYRQEKIFDRLNIVFNRITMCKASVRAYERCGELERLLKRELKNSYFIGVDETIVQVLKEPDKPPQSKSYMWAFRGGTKENPIILFHYDPSRSGKVPKEYLLGYKGRLQSDGYGGYNWVEFSEDIIHYGCWSHSRRKFIEAVEVSKIKDGVSHQIIDLIGILYENERYAKSMEYSRDEVKNYRQKHSKPILSEIKKILLENIGEVAPQTKCGIAINYTLLQWEKLERYVDDGLIPIDNNLVENTIRPFVVGRKNWLFFDSQDGARASAFFYSLIETAKANKLEPYSYLNYVFEQVPLCKTESDYEKLLPMFVDRTKIKTYKIPQ
ncbi:MAG TPA: IS66 family transposase [Spirochaetota bacterium]|nr:IS66 family transposase [Spirochaetota bacterium]